MGGEAWNRAGVGPAELAIQPLGVDPDGKTAHDAVIFYKELEPVGGEERRRSES